ncbi:CynX/NimT family MFS transporter [Phytohabitans kaempferiae]|uniref:CynX/NimT family MFS transporter n=1 Tax=Phytohabitans kaempferiae TaxID=1620943 RepID=A0ABV6LWV9_9ACTN
MEAVAPPASTLAAPVPAAIQTGPAARPRGTALILAGILLVALNLRVAITSLGALLEEVRTGLHLSGAMAGVVTTMPTIAFAAFGALAPWLVRRFTAGRIVLAAMVALLAGEAVRVATGSTVVFIATSAVALAGIAVANILLPLLVRQHFPHRTGLVTGAYTVSLTIGASVAAASAVPIADAFGSWRAGLGAWSLLAVIAMLPWLPAVFRRRTTQAAVAPLAARVRPARTRVGWAMAIYFGAQALSGHATMGWLAQLFRDSGYRPQTAGLLLAGVTAVGIPVALVMPALAMRLNNLRPLVLGLSATMIASYVGLAIAPHDGAVVWVVLLSIGQGAFPLALVAIGLRARTPEGTVALSAFTQCLGYLIAALGPLVVGALYELTGGWNLPLGFLIGAAVVQIVAGLAVARPRFVED